VLFGSILLYSLANIANAFVDTIPSYALLRFLAGFGLAGELGAGVTLVAEIVPSHLRGYGTTIIAGVGVVGAIAAGLTGDLLPWRGAYLLGGGLGLVLLLLRVSVAESKLFEEVQRHGSSVVGIFALFSSPGRAARFIMCILLGIPIWYIIGIILANSRDLAIHLQAGGMPRPGLSIAACYFGILIGDIVGGLMSQYLKSRKVPIAFFLALSGALPLWFLTTRGLSLSGLYWAYVALGFAAGYWVLVVTSAAEQFGTNIRSTVTTSVSNFIRGAVVPVSAVFLWLQPRLGLVDAALFVGLGVVLLAVVALVSLQETFSRDLDFIEK
jgi:MFS family permease